MATIDKSSKISVIGLGQMGKKIAQLYVDAGFDVFVWNRTESKTADLKDVKITNTASEAISASPISIICVYDNNATSEILESITDKKILAGKTIVNLTTGSPKEASHIGSIVAAHRGYYINGAIQVAPDQMGLESTTILLSGSAYFENKPVLDILGGNLKLLSEEPAASSAMDLATLTWLYGSYIGLIYGAALSRQYGLKLDDFSAIIGEITPGFTDFFKHEIEVISKSDYQITQSPLSISVAATQRIADSFKELDVLQEFPGILARILAEASQKGLAGKELAAIIKIIERKDQGLILDLVP